MLLNNSDSDLAMIYIFRKAEFSVCMLVLCIFNRTARYVVSNSVLNIFRRTTRSVGSHSMFNIFRRTTRSMGRHLRYHSVRDYRVILAVNPLRVELLSERGTEGHGGGASEPPRPLRGAAGAQHRHQSVIGVKVTQGRSESRWLYSKYCSKVIPWK